MSVVCDILIDFLKKICKCIIPEKNESTIIFIYKDDELINYEKENINMETYSSYDKNNNTDEYFSCYESVR